MGFTVHTIFKNGDEEYENTDTQEQADKLAKRNRSRGAKSDVMMYKGGSKQHIEILKKQASAGSIAAQDALREIFSGYVEAQKKKGVFDQQGATFIKKDMATMGVSDWQPRKVDDDLGVEDDPASSPEDLSDVKSDYDSDPAVMDINEATQAWLAGDTRPARELGLSESDIEMWLAQTRVPMQTMRFGQSVRNVGLDNVETANELDDAIEQIKPKSAGALRTSQKLGRPSSFTR